MSPSQDYTALKTLGNPSTWFYLFCGLHLVLWFAAHTIPDLTPHTSTLEGVVWGNAWEWGYPKHPYFVAWLCALISQTHHGFDWPFYLVEQLSVVLCFLALWKFGNRIFSPWYCFIAIVILEAIEFYNFRALAVNPDIVSLPLWALTTMTFYLAMKDNRLSDWLWFGLFAGLAIMTKYVALLLIASLGLLLLLTPQGRQTWRGKGVYLSAIVCGIVILPHFLWVVEHGFVTMTYVLDEVAHTKSSFLSHIVNPAQFAGGVLLRVLVVLAFFTPFLLCKTSDQSIDSFDKRFIAFAGIGPLAIALMLSMVTGLSVQGGWAYPFFNLIGFVFLMIKKPVLTPRAIKQFAAMIGIFTVALLVLREPYRVYYPHITGKAPYRFMPAKQMAIKAEALWQTKYESPLPYVAGHRQLVKFIVPYLSNKPVGFYDWNLNISPWVDEQAMLAKGAIFVWYDDGKGKLPAYLPKNYQHAQYLGVYEFPMLTTAEVKPAKIGFAILPAVNE